MMIDETEKAIKIIGWISLIILLIIFGPIVLIWSLNTLFPLDIPSSFSTWLATIFLFGGATIPLIKRQTK